MVPSVKLMSRFFICVSNVDFTLEFTSLAVSSELTDTKYS